MLCWVDVHVVLGGCRHVVLGAVSWIGMEVRDVMCGRG